MDGYIRLDCSVLEVYSLVENLFIIILDVGRILRTFTLYTVFSDSNNFGFSKYLLFLKQL